jgi:uncharacterized cupin superfamily protein
VSKLGDKLLALHDALETAGIAHAFGGAIALAYCTHEPRGTIDIDINIFLDPGDAARAFDLLPSGVAHASTDRVTAERDGQVRLFWDDTPVDVFFAYHEFHHTVAGRIRNVPFDGAEIPVLACQDLIVFKAFFARTKDWADIEAMVAVNAVDGQEASRAVADLLGAEHPSYVRLLATMAQPSSPM